MRLLLSIILLLIIFLSACNEKALSEKPFLPETNSEVCPEEHILFEYPPANLSGTDYIVPLGLMTGSHVTPIDHQYLTSHDGQLADIYSPGDGVVNSIQHMSGYRYDSEQNKEIEWADYRIVIDHGCGIESIYIHMDELSPKLAAAAPPKGEHASVRIEVEAGEVIGQYRSNLDYNIVDQSVILQGLIVPEHYESESWKIHVPNTNEYFVDELRVKMEELSLRDEEPFAGKFDHDIDGTLQGNWFLEGSDYGGGFQDYWKGHLSISPEHLDYSYFIISMGDYDGRAEQFGTLTNSPYPSTVDVNSGIIKYELTSYDHYAGNTRWDRQSLLKGLKAKSYPNVQGVVLVQMIEDRKLKFEVFPGKEGDDVEGFTSAAKIYER